jgi:hypothetical protein
MTAYSPMIRKVAPPLRRQYESGHTKEHFFRGALSLRSGSLRAPLEIRA